MPCDSSISIMTALPYMPSQMHASKLPVDLKFPLPFNHVVRVALAA